MLTTESVPDLALLARDTVFVLGERELVTLCKDTIVNVTGWDSWDGKTIDSFIVTTDDGHYSEVPEEALRF